MTQNPIQKPPKPSKVAYNLYLQEEELSAEHYLQFWKDFFVSYGFVIVPNLDYVHCEFRMIFNGRTASIYCCPSRFQGIEIFLQGVVGKPYVYVKKKVISETGAIKWMQENGLGVPH